MVINLEKLNSVNLSFKVLLAFFINAFLVFQFSLPSNLFYCPLLESLVKCFEVSATNIKNDFVRVASSITTESLAQKKVFSSK